MEIKHKTTIELNAYFDGETLKSHDCDISDWYGDTICERIDITDKIESIKIPIGKYKINISFEYLED